MDVCDSGNFRLTKNQGVSSFVVYRVFIIYIYIDNLYFDGSIQLNEC
jgi:hypothetical protein